MYYSALTPFLPDGLDIDFQLAYNHKEGVISQLVEVAVQKRFDIWKHFWNYLSDVDPAPDWFQDAAKKLVKEYDFKLYISDTDLQQQVADYHNEINIKHRRVIVVAHSQGNFYANAAHSLVDASKYYIVSVASPASSVAGNGPHFNLTTDKIMSWIVPGNLSSNVTNNSDKNKGWAGHDFIKSYLEGDVTGPGIMQAVTKLMDDEIACREKEKSDNENVDEGGLESTDSTMNLDNESIDTYVDTENNSEPRLLIMSCQYGSATLEIDGRQLAKVALDITLKTAGISLEEYLSDGASFFAKVDMDKVSTFEITGKPNVEGCKNLAILNLSTGTHSVKYTIDGTTPVPLTNSANSPIRMLAECDLAFDPEVQKSETDDRRARYKFHSNVSQDLESSPFSIYNTGKTIRNDSFGDAAQMMILRGCYIDMKESL